MKYVIPGVPVSQGRPRSIIRGGKIIVFNPDAKEMNIARNFVKCTQIQNDYQTFGENEPLAVGIVFEMQIPESWSKKKKLECVGKEHFSKPDIDNLQKFAQDVLNGIAYHDDSQISSIQCKKIYSETPQTTIYIYSRCQAYERFSDGKMFC